MGKKSKGSSPSDESYKSERRDLRNKERRLLKEEKRKTDKIKQRERRLERKEVNDVKT